VIVRILACLVAICLIGGAVQASDLTTPDTAAELELAPTDLDMIVPGPIVEVGLVRHPMPCDLPAASSLQSRLPVTDAFRPPQV
jgi:hypothetical protein